MGKPLIFVSGSSVGGSVKRVMRAHDIVCCRDSFVTGPLTRVSDYEGFVQARGAYWKTIPLDPGFGLEPEYVVWDTIWPSLDERIARADVFEIWVGNDLGDTLFATFTTLFLIEQGVRNEQIALRRFSLDRRAGLYAFSEDKLKDLPEKSTLDSQEIHRLRRYWDAVCVASLSPQIEYPQEIDDTESWTLDLLRGRWPDPKTGLTNLQTYLLRDAPLTQKKAAHFVGNGMVNAIPDSVGDLVLFEELKRMGAPEQGAPLVEIFGSGRSMRVTEAKLTNEGITMRAQLE